jgi:hypothetical protein
VTRLKKTNITIKVRRGASVRAFRLAHCRATALACPRLAGAGA